MIAINAESIDPKKIVIPRFYIGSIKHTSKMKMRKAYQSAFSYTSTDKNWVYHYSSPTQTYAYAHAWLKTINQNYSPPDSWCLLQDLGKGQLYFMWVKTGVVQLALQCTANSIDAIILHRAQRIYITESTLKSLTGNVEVQQIDALTNDNLKGFSLKSTRHRDIRFLLILVVLIATVATISWRILQPEKSVVTPIVDKYNAYNEKLKYSFNASDAIKNAINLAAYGTLAPDGWKFTNISLQDGVITLNLERQPHGLRSVIDLWLNIHHELKGLSQIGTNAVVIKVPLSQGISKWNTRTLSIDKLTNNIKDFAVLQNWQINNDSSTSQDNVILHELTLIKTNSTLAELRSLSYLLAHLPVNIKNLNLQNDAIGVVNTSLSIEFIGVN